MKLQGQMEEQLLYLQMQVIFYTLALHYDLLFIYMK